MKRQLITLALAGAVALGCSAVPAKRIINEVLQPDGSTVTLYLQGDEFCGGLFTADGYAAAINADGHAVYCSTTGATDILVHDEGKRTPRETEYLATEGPRTTLAAMIKDLPTERAAERSLLKSAGVSAPKLEQGGATLDIATGNTQVPHFGSPHIPIILADYTDVKFRDGANAMSTFRNFFNESAKSALSYFHDASGGQFTPQFHLIGPVNLSRNRKYYGEHISNNMPDANIYKMVTEACQLADPDLDFSIFDNDGDGVCDVVIILYAGVGEASSNVSDAVWPCQGTLTGVNSITCDETKMAKFAVFNELNGDQRTIAGVGTFCHEFSHCLGLPDIYDVNYGGTFGMDKWSVMDYGSYNDNGNTPVGYSAYEKAFMGWFQPAIAQDNTHYSLPVQNVSAEEAPQAVAVVNKSNPDEYYILENRRRQGWDSFSEADGLMITHVNFRSNVWSSNSVNTGGNNFLTIIPADNSRDKTSLSGDLWPYGSKNALTNVTLPAAATYTGNYMNQPITDITIDAESGDVSFWISRGAEFGLETPEFASEADTAAGGSFTSCWNAVTGASSYMLQAWPKNELEYLPQEWLLPAKGFDVWEKNDGVKNYPNGSSGAYCVLGNTNITGQVVSPATLEEDNGALTVWVSAHKYGTTSGAQIIVTLLDADGKEIDKSTFVVNNKDDEYFPVLFTGLNSEKPYQLAVGNLEVGKRVMLTGVYVFRDDATPLAAEQLEDAADFAKSFEAPGSDAKANDNVSISHCGRITVRNIADTSYTVTDLSAGDYQYRVKGVAGKGSSRSESRWSEVREVTVTDGESSVNTVDTGEVGFHIDGRIIYAPAASSLYTPAGVKIKASDEGRFEVSPGIYILSIGERSEKIVIK